MCNVLQSFGDEGHPLIGWPQGSEVFQKKTAFSSPGSYFFTARNDCQVNERMDRLPHGYIERNAYIYIYVHIIHEAGVIGLVIRAEEHFDHHIASWKPKGTPQYPPMPPPPEETRPN